MKLVWLIQMLSQEMVEILSSSSLESFSFLKMGVLEETYLSSAANGRNRFERENKYFITEEV